MLAPGPRVGDFMSSAFAILCHHMKPTPYRLTVEFNFLLMEEFAFLVYARIHSTLNFSLTTAIETSSIQHESVRMRVKRAAAASDNGRIFKSC